MEGRSVAEIGRRLEQYLGPEFISERSGEGGRKLSYLEGHELVGLLNSILGWDGWQTRIVNSTTDYEDVSNGGKWSVGVATTVRLIVRVKGDEGTREVAREDVGYGMMENAPSRGKAMEKARKEATTDGLKRAARLLGNATGGCLYNKEYLTRLKKVRGPAERIDFEEDDLLRKTINKRKRFMLAEEKARAVSGDKHEDDEFGEDGETDDAFREVSWAEELIGGL